MSGNKKKHKGTIIFICLVAISAALVGLLYIKLKKSEKKYDADHPGEISMLRTAPEHISTDQYAISFADNEILIEVSPKLSKKRVEKLAKAYDASIVGRIEQTGDYQLQLDNSLNREELESICREIENEDIVKSACINYFFDQKSDSVDYEVNYGDEWRDNIEKNDNDIGWHINSINAPEAWKVCDRHKETINPVKVGIIDTTFDPEHEDLKNCIAESFYDTYGNMKSKYKNGYLTYKDYAHGTHVMGTFVADGSNSKGICGVYPYGKGNTYLASWTQCEEKNKNIPDSLYAFKCYLSDLITRDVKVINCSYYIKFLYLRAFLFDGFESDEENIAYREENKAIAIETAKRLGEFLQGWLDKGYDFVIVCSAGNLSDKDMKLTDTSKGHKVTCQVHTEWVDARYNSFYTLIDENDYPDVYNRIIVVGYVNNNKEKGKHTCIGDRVDVYAPGEGIYSTIPGNKYQSSYKDSENKKHSWSGSSFAAPQVAGVAAMVWSLDNNLKGDEVKRIIVDASRDENLEYGYFLDAYKAVLAVAGTEEEDIIADNTSSEERDTRETSVIAEDNTEEQNDTKIEKNKEVIPRTRKRVTAYYGKDDKVRWIENYDSSGVRTDIKDSDGSIIKQYEYDNDGNCVREQWYSEGKDAGHAEYAYDAAGNCTWSYYKRAGGYVVEQTFEYDAAGNMIRKTHTMDEFTTIQENEYDANGNLISWRGTDSSGGEEEYVVWKYDSNGFRTGGTYYVNNVIDSDYLVETDNRGNITKQSRVREGEVLNSESFEYDDFGNITKKYKNDSLIEESEYDDRGNCLKHIEYSGENGYQYLIYEYWD